VNCSFGAMAVRLRMSATRNMLQQKMRQRAQQGYRLHEACSELICGAMAMRLQMSPTRNMLQMWR
jgi:hypothetical protein